VSTITGIYFLLAAVPHAQCLKPASVTLSSMKFISSDAHPLWPTPATIVDFSYSKLSHFELFRGLPFQSYNVGDAFNEFLARPIEKSRVPFSQPLKLEAFFARHSVRRASQIRERFPNFCPVATHTPFPV
jgi:hypothetical protein